MIFQPICIPLKARIAGSLNDAMITVERNFFTCAGYLLYSPWSI